MAFCLDTSAAVKLVVEERGSTALRRWLDGTVTPIVSSDLTRTVLRNLDAIHLAVALDLGDDLDGIVTYDDRLAAAAEGLGVAVIAPT